MANVEINALTGKATPVGTDELEIQETGGGASKKVTLAAIKDEYLDLDDPQTHIPISALTTNNTVDTAADVIAFYDNDVGAVRKTIVDTIVNRGTTATQINSGNATILATAAGLPLWDGGVKVWLSVTYSGGVPTEDDSLNVTSLTDSGTGNCQVGYTSTIGASGASHVLVASPRSQSAGTATITTFPLTGTTGRVFQYTAGSAADIDFTMCAMGDKN